MAFDLAGFAAELVELQVEVHDLKTEGMKKACEVIEKGAKEAIGTYAYGWPQLAPFTQADRINKGYSANDPLLRDGTLRDSINHEVQGRDNPEGFVGTPMKIGLWQELGTSRIPARSFLGDTVKHKGQEAVDQLTGIVLRPLVHRR